MEQILQDIYKLIADAKLKDEKHVCFFGVASNEIIKQIESEGYTTNKFGSECLVIGWGRKKGNTSGKMTIPTILHFIEKLAKHSRQILCHIFT